MPDPNLDPTESTDLIDADAVDFTAPAATEAPPRTQIGQPTSAGSNAAPEALDGIDPVTGEVLDPAQQIATPTSTPQVVINDPPDNDTLYVGRSPDIEPMEQAIERIFKVFGLERLGGASGRGWSFYSSMQKCWWFFKRRYRDRDRGGANYHLELGGLFHTYMALFYLMLRDGDAARLTPIRMHREILDTSVDHKVVMEAWRIFQAYCATYDDDYLTPLEAEYLAKVDDKTSCRYDLIARVEEDVLNVPAGTWIVEHKTASRFDSGTLEGWKNDGEIIGQIRLYKKAKLAKRFGKLKGVIVNLCGKQKEPKFERIVIPTQARQLRAHEKDLQVWDAMRGICEATNTWPRSRQGCVDRYGLCDYFDECAGDTKR